VDKYERLWEGLLAGWHDINLKNPFNNINSGRGELSAEAWEKYSEYKTAAEIALKKGDITTEQFNFIKGKAGAHTVTNRYINREDFPLLHHLLANGENIYYQSLQSINDGQPWLDAIEDYWEQDAGVEDPTPLGTPWEEIQRWVIENSIDDTN